MSPKTSRLLLLIGDPDLGGILKLALRENDLELFGRAGPAEDALRRRSFDLALVDLSVEGRPAALELIRKWRRAGGAVPIIALSDYPQPSLAIEALDAGADDFLRKPFHHDELLARIRKLGRRAPAPPPRRAGGVMLERNPFVFGGATVTPDLMVRFPLGQEERIRPKQHGILKVFSEHAGALVLKEALVKSVWGSDGNDAGHSVNEYVSILRRLFLRHGVDFNRLVVSEPKAGWRIHPSAAAGRPDPAA